jgi:N-acetylglucosaminyl-diphospho-decaprenol L-rhamnosyltransferase
MNKFVNIVIVGFDNPNDIQYCLEALSKSTYRHFSVTICENGGIAAYKRLSSRVPTVLSSGQTIKIVQANSNLGFAGGVNFALQNAGKAEVTWILNPDTAPSPSALHFLMIRLAKGDCDAVGCRVILPNGLIQSYGGRWNKWLGRSKSIGFGTLVDTDISGHDVEIYQNYLNGASMLVSSHFLDVVGLMREEYFLYGEEIEWFLRAKKNGMKLGFASDADVLHFHGTTTGGGRGFHGASKLALFLGERNRVLVTWDIAPLLLVIVLPMSLMFLIAQCLRHRALKQFRPGISGWWAGLRNVRGIPPFARRNLPIYEPLKRDINSVKPPLC